MGDDARFFDTKALERVFGQMVSDDYYARLVSGDNRVAKDCDERPASILFIDMHGFTKFMRETPPPEAMATLRALNDIVLEEIQAHDGCFLLSIGDASLVVFGAPLAEDERGHALKACRAALGILSRRLPDGVVIGAGINTGTVYLGSTTADRMPTYTVIGNTVNDASRMEGESHNTGGRLAIGRRTNELVGDIYRTAFCGRLPANAYRDPLPFYAVIGERATIAAPESAFWDRYDEAADLLERGSLSEALARFEGLEAERPSDGLLSAQTDRARRAYAESMSAAFENAGDLAELTRLLAGACSTLAPGAAIGMLERSMDGLWRFRPDAPFEASPLVVAPEGDAAGWLMGLSGPARTEGAPTPLDSAGFELWASLKVRNRLEAALAFRFPRATDTDAAAIGILATALAEPWVERRAAWLRERYREKIDDATKLEEVNRELEFKSAQLEKALAEIRALNEGLEAKVSAHSARLERASALKRYLPPAVVDDIIEGRRDVAPRTERRKITVLFSDIRGFTEATDGIEPEELSRLLDEYLSSMSSVAFAHGATIDKFRGDGMMVFFGAPAPMETADGARACLRMAVAMCREVERLRAKWYDEGYNWDLGVRMGVNTGYATVGEFGCAERMDYTAIGTEVNLASRLESSGEADAIVVSHATWALIRDVFPCTPLGDIVVKGIHRPVRAYSVDWKDWKPEPGPA